MWRAPDKPRDGIERLRDVEHRRSYNEIIKQIEGITQNVTVTYNDYAFTIETLTQQLDSLLSNHTKYYSEDFSSQSSLAINHDLNSNGILVRVLKDNTARIIPATTDIKGKSDIVITFDYSLSGRVLVAAADHIQGYKKFLPIKINKPREGHKVHTLSNTWTTEHELDSDKIIVQFWKDRTTDILPQSCTITDKDTLTTIFNYAIAGSISYIALKPDMGYSYFSKDFTGVTSAELAHNFNTEEVMAQFWKDGTTLIEPPWEITDRNTVTATFGDTIDVRGNLIPLT